ncbi:MAG: right-handed parallel beta-helix repeat-containing protein [Actinomycetaceae bacterium]|nr:right-handed parallel beta-helix repeat-containing protein [Actinomycetaceae bacterium]
MKLTRNLFALVCAGTLLAAGAFLNIAPAEAAAAKNAVVLTNGTPPAGAIVVSAQTQSALQTALNQAGAQGTPSKKGVVWIPAGTYVIGGPLKIPSNTKVVADSGATIRGNHLIVYSDIDGSRGYNGPHDIEIVGGTWDGGARSGQKTANNGGFMIRHGKNITFDRVTVTNCVNHFINVSASTNVVIKNSTFKNQVIASNSDTEFWADNSKPATVTEVIHLDFADNGENAITVKDGTPAGKVLVENNTFENVISAVGNHRTIATLKNGAYKSKVGGLTVRGNTFKKISGRVITLASMDNAVIEKNKLSGTAPINFLYALDSKNAKLIGNGSIASVFMQKGSTASIGSGHKLQNASDVAVFVDDKSKLDMTGCTVNNSQYGISARNGSTINLSNVTISNSAKNNATYDSSSKGTISKSTFRNAGQHGIRAANGSVVTVQNSVIENSAQDGIQLEKAGSGCKITNNTVRSSGRFGIYVTGVKKATISGNRVSSKANYGGQTWVDLRSKEGAGNVFKNNCISSKGKAFSDNSADINNNDNGCAAAQPKPVPVEKKCSGKQVFRLYNPGIGGKHHYTLDQNEKNVLVSKYGWQYEGVAWCAPKSGTKGYEVYRLYNPVSSAHHYTMDSHEKSVLTAQHGWRYEGVAWYSDPKKSVELRRLYNQNLPQPAQHHYTTDTNEWNVLIAQHGWKAEGTAWYGEKPIK